MKVEEYLREDCFKYYRLYEEFYFEYYRSINGNIG